MATQVGSIYYDLDLESAKFDANLRKADASAKSFGSRLSGYFDNTAQASRTFAVGLGIVGTAVGVLGGKALQTAGDLESMKQGFVTLLGSVDKADAAIKMISKDAASTPFELKGLIQANQLLTSVTKDANKSERFLLNIGKALSSMGKGQAELDRIIVNLQQIGAVGHASMIDIKQFAFAGIPIFDMLKDRLKVTGGALADMISDGKITFSMLEDMFNRAGEAGGRFEKGFINQAGTFNQLVSNMKDVMTIFMSDLVKDTGIFDSVKAALSRLITYMTDNKDKITKFFKDALGWIEDHKDGIIGAIMGGIIPAIIALGVAVATSPLTPWIVGGYLLGIVLGNLADKMGGWKNMLNELKPALKSTSGFLGGLKDTFMGLWDGIKRGAQEVWPIVKAAFSLFSDQLKRIGNSIKFELIPALQELWDLVQPYILPALKVMAVIIGSILVGAFWLLINVIEGIIITLTSVVKVINFLVDTFQAAMTGIVTFWMNAWDGVKIAWEAVKNWFAGLPGIIKGFFTDAWNGVVAVWTGAKNFFKNLIDDIGKGFGRVTDFIVAPFKAAFNSISSLWNKSVGKLHFSLPSWIPGIGGNGFDMPNLPMLAKGGIVTRPTLAMIGEGREAEAVIPLSKIKDVMKDAAGGAKVETHIHGNFYFSKEADEDRFIDKLNRNQERAAKGGSLA